MVPGAQPISSDSQFGNCQTTRPGARLFPPLQGMLDLQQLWLDHLLALSMVQHPSEELGPTQFLLVYPEQNVSFASAAERYREALKNERTFETRTLEQLLDAHFMSEELEKAF